MLAVEPCAHMQAPLLHTRCPLWPLAHLRGLLAAVSAAHACTIGGPCLPFHQAHVGAGCWLHPVHCCHASRGRGGGVGWVVAWGLELVVLAIPGGMEGCV